MTQRDDGDGGDAEGHVAPRRAEREHGSAVGDRGARRPQRQGHEREGRRVPAGAARVHAAGQDDRRRPARGRAAADRRGPGHRQDDDGPPDGAQRRVRRPGQRPLHLLRARRAVPAQPADRRGVGARPPAAQDRRDQDPGRPQGDPRDVDGRGRRRRPAGGQPAAPPVARPDRPLRAEPVPAPRHADRVDDRRHARARSASTRSCRATGGCSSSSDYLQKVPVDPRAAQRVREGHVRRSTASRTSP